MINMVIFNHFFYSAPFEVMALKKAPFVAEVFASLIFFSRIYAFNRTFFQREI